MPDAAQALAPILAGEADRMAIAEAVTDLLGARSPAPPEAVAPRPRRSVDSKPASSEPRSRPETPKGIADFIDEMLAESRAAPSEAGR